MADGDFAAVVAIAAERPDISIFLSSTPTGRRSFFYEACVNKDLGYKEFYFPSMANPNWGEEMEAEFRSSLTELQYIHEVLAEFGPQETGVFDKKKLDEAIKMDLYAYDELNYLQERTLDVPIENIKFFIPEKGERGYYPNKYRTMGVDWDKKALKYKNKEKLTELYNKYKNGYKIAEVIGVDSKVLYRWLKNFNITNKNYKRRKVDDTYFDIIDTEKKAYWLGFLMADGCISYSKNKNKFQFGIVGGINILEQFQNEFKKEFILTKIYLVRNEIFNLATSSIESIKKYMIICTRTQQFF